MHVNAQQKITKDCIYICNQQFKTYVDSAINSNKGDVIKNQTAIGIVL